MSKALTDIKESTQRQFGSSAANYRSSAVHISGQDLTTMVIRSHLAPTARVLDAGCGPGHTALAFARHVRQVVAYDLTPEMLQMVNEMADERGLSNIITRQGDVENLPFQDGEFCAVVSRYSGHHWPNPLRALHEFHRVLRHGGQVIISDVTAPQETAIDTFMQSFEILRDQSHVRDHTTEQWLTMMQSAGFQTEVLLNFEVRLKFEDWLNRSNTEQIYRDAILALFEGATLEVKKAFQLPDSLRGNFEFVIPGTVFKGTRN